MAADPLYTTICYYCDQEVDDIKVHNPICVPKVYRCEGCGTDVKRKCEVAHNLICMPIKLGYWTTLDYQPLEKIKFEEELGKIRGSSGWKVIKKRRFGLLWDDDHHTAVAALENLNRDDLKKNVSRGNEVFHREPGVQCVSPRCYAALQPSCEIGHLAAALFYRLCKEDLLDTFTMANGIPQLKRFNLSQIKRLEGHFYRLVKMWHDGIQATGPIYKYSEDTPQKSLNHLDIFTPRAVFKVIKLRRKGQESFIQAFRADMTNSNFRSLYSMRTTIELIELETGANLDIFKGCRYTWDVDFPFFRCVSSNCASVFLSQVELDTHRLIHLWKCTYCTVHFNSEAERTTHIVTFHMKHKCPRCGKVFPTASVLKYHIAQCIDAREYACDQCDAKFNTKNDLKVHIKGAHEVVMELCPMDGCGIWYNKSFMSTHLSRKHKGKNHRCTEAIWCNAAFTTASDLRRHITYVHAFVPTHRCLEVGCEREFGSFHNLCVHLKKDHGLKQSLSLADEYKYRVPSTSITKSTADLSEAESIPTLPVPAAAATTFKASGATPAAYGRQPSATITSGAFLSQDSGTGSVAERLNQYSFETSSQESSATEQQTPPIGIDTSPASHVDIIDLAEEDPPEVAEIEDVVVAGAEAQEVFVADEIDEVDADAAVEDAVVDNADDEVDADTAGDGVGVAQPRNRGSLFSWLGRANSQGAIKRKMDSGKTSTPKRRRISKKQATKGMKQLSEFFP